MSRSSNFIVSVFSRILKASSLPPKYVGCLVVLVVAAGLMPVGFAATAADERFPDEPVSGPSIPWKVPDVSSKPKAAKKKQAKTPVKSPAKSPKALGAKKPVWAAEQPPRGKKSYKKRSRADAPDIESSEQIEERSMLAQSASPATSLYGRNIESRNNLTVSIISGEVSSTYLRMAADLSNVLDVASGEDTLRVIPVVGKGGIQNVLDVLFLRGIDMGIIQQGQLSYMQLTNPDLFKDIKARLKYVAKLYNAEFHVLARRDVKSMRDLKDRRISLGKRLGSTDMIGRTILSELEIDVTILNDDLAASVEKLRTGELDAVAVLGGAPIQGLAGLREPEKYHFLAIDPTSVGLNSYFNLVDEFLPTKITSDHYPGLVRPDAPVPSIASGVVMVVYNWKPDTKRYKKLESFVDHFFTRFEEFRRPERHPKWHEVSIHAKVPGLLRFEAADEWLKKRRIEIGREVSAGEMKIAMDVFVRQYSQVSSSEEVTPLQRDDIWLSLNRVFGRWWESGDDGL